MFAKFQTSRRRRNVGRRKGLRGVHKYRRNHDEGVIIVLVAVFMLGAVGAMAALSIDVITLYTARSEAQLAADAGALAAARALANSGATSDSTGTLMPLAEPLASNVAIQVAQSSFVGGRYLDASKGEVVVSFSDSQNNPCTALNPTTNPCVTVSVQRTDLPTFFARIWGSSQVKVATSATAEAYNATNISGAGTNPNPPVAPICVKPWLLPNIDPTTGNTTIFDPTSGTITNATLLNWPPSGAPVLLHAINFTSNATAWRFYAGDQSSFPAPAGALPSCTPSLTRPYEESIAGCVQTSIACNKAVEIDSAVIPLRTRNTQTADAVNCLTHAANSGGADSVAPAGPPSSPFEFIGGSNNPIAGASNNDVMVSDSLVTVPVYDVGPGPAPFPAPPVPPGTVTIIGFLQLFVNADGNDTQNTGGPGSPNGKMNVKIVNMVGCGAIPSTVQPIFGNGASPVAVRLVSP